MTYWQAWMACGLLTSLPAAAQADIFRWDNGQLIPGTQGITPGPATQFGARDLQFAELSNTNLTGSSFYDYMLHGSDLRGARFTNANLSYTVLTASNLSGADFAGATIIGTYLYGTQGFTKEQLYSTASYQAKDLHEIGFGSSDLTGWDLSGQNLTGAALSMLTNANLAGADLTNAYLDYATLTDANLAGAIVRGASFKGYGARGFTKEQLYSTASYQQRDLNGINLSENNLTGWDFSGQDLTGAEFAGSTLTSADFAGAVVAGANFTPVPLWGEITGTGIALPQLYSTASYQQKNLRGIGLGFNDLTGGDLSGQDLTGARFWGSTLTNASLAGANLTNAGLEHVPLTNTNFAGANLTNAYLSGANLTNANLSGANLTNARLERSDCGSGGCGSVAAILTNANLAGAKITGAEFSNTTPHGFTKEQLYSTASYQQKNLRGIGLSRHDLTSGDFSGQDLAGANFSYSTLTNANLAEAMVTRANFVGTTSSGFTKDQLYSTASYQQRDLNGINLSQNDLTGWDFSGQDLSGADLDYSKLTNANFSFADLRGARTDSASRIQLARNSIWKSGLIFGLDLAAGETLVVRDSDMGILVNGSMNAVSGGTLELVLGDADWGSTMAGVVTPDLGGTLRVRFADQANLASMLGTTFDFFDWPAVLDTNNRFDAIELPPGTQWDLNQLYVTGTAKLTFIPATPGDYNRDGTVDAADYVVWRSGLGTTYTQTDYDVWRANFGRAPSAGWSIGSGAADPLSRVPASAEPLPIAVPEPATLTLLIMAVVVHYARRRSTVS